ncbi:MAG: HAD-IIB family hydrolase [Jannaschia sp.]
MSNLLGPVGAQADRLDVSRVDVVLSSPGDGSGSSEVERSGPKSTVFRIGFGERSAHSAGAPGGSAAALRCLVYGLARVPDIFHAHSLDAFEAVKDVAHEQGVPIVWSPGAFDLGGGGLETALDADLRVERERAALQMSSAVIVASRDAAERQAEGYGIDVAARVHRIPPGTVRMPTGDASGWTGWAASVGRVYARVLASPRPLIRTVTALLACDIDGTLTGCRSAAVRFADWAAGRQIPFAVATGRSISEARAVLDRWDLPDPDLFVTAVGTEIHRSDETGALALCRTFAEELERGWDRAAALDVLATSGLEMQPEVEQRRWKLAAYGSGEEAVVLRHALAEAGLAVRVVASHDRLIDLLAPNGGKAAALAFAARGFGLSLDECIAAGDSGNDADMLATSGRAILVANADRDLDGLPPRRGLYRSPMRHADGVLDGLERFGVLRPGQGMRQGMRG